MKLLKFDGPRPQKSEKVSGLVAGACVLVCDCGNSSIALRLDDPNCENGLSATCKNCFQTYYVDDILKEFKECDGD